jgi:hypothetical protein
MSTFEEADERWNKMQICGDHALLQKTHHVLIDVMNRVNYGWALILRHWHPKRQAYGWF